LSFAKASETTRRKTDHIHAALHADVTYHTRTSGFERYELSYEALPEIDRSEVDTSTTLLGHRLSMPFVISSMTGGAPESREINRLLAEAAQRFGIAFGVGSQRAALEDPGLAYTYQVRDVAPDILLFANLGAIQLNHGCGVESCAAAVEMIQADALILHLNPLQECVQAQGNMDFRHLADKIGEVCEMVGVPVIAKEVGHGISERTARLLIDAGVDAIDVAGAGGTSWAKVERVRATDDSLRDLGAALGEWGIPTVDSLLAVRSISPHITVIASGGVRTGPDIAKSIALGADAAGMALPLLQSACAGRETLFSRIANLREELATIMFCTGARTIGDLRGLRLCEAHDQK